MVYDKNLLNDIYCIIIFAVYNGASDGYLGDITSQNNKPLSLLSRRLINTQCNYAKIYKLPPSIV